MTEEDARRILHLAPGCSPEQVRQAYRDLVKVWHPDRFQGDARLKDKADRSMQELNEAYQTLQGPRRVDPPPPAPPDPPRRDPHRPRDASRAQTGAARARRSFRIGIRGGIAIGLGVGVIGAIGAALWVGPPQPRAAVDDPANSDIFLSTAEGSVRSSARPAPESGTDLVSPARTGRATLVLKNAGLLDGAAILAVGDTHTRAVYVRAGEQVTVLNIAPGTYRVLLMLGREWRREGFTEDATYQQLDAPIELEARDLNKAASRTPVTVSLHPEVAGRAGVRNIDAFRLQVP
jgi:hypothetical protein